MESEYLGYEIKNNVIAFFLDEDLQDELRELRMNFHNNTPLKLSNALWNKLRVELNRELWRELYIELNNELKYQL